MLTIDQLVPKDHLVRKLEAAIDFSFNYPLVENLLMGVLVLILLFSLSFCYSVHGSNHQKHGMRWTTLRGLKKLSCRRCLLYAAMNLKKRATWTWQPA